MARHTLYNLIIHIYFYKKGALIFLSLFKTVTHGGLKQHPVYQQYICCFAANYAVLLQFNNQHRDMRSAQTKAILSVALISTQALCLERDVPLLPFNLL